MIAFVLSSGNAPFTTALLVVAGLVILELISLLIGFTLSGLLDNLMPDFDLSVDLDGDGIPDVGPAGHVASWFHLGDVPVMALVGVWLTGYGLAGWVIQSFAEQYTGSLMNPWIAGIPAALIGFGASKLVGSLLVRLGIREETTAVSADSLLGSTAVITLGTATKAQPSQAKLRDKHGQTHYVLVEPIREGDIFANGDSVTLVKRDGAKYYVVGGSVDALLSLGVDDLSEGTPQKA